jgi:hypothetical protein
MPSLSSLDNEINCLISFKTPQDYDDNTGLMLKSGDPGFVESTFDGVYKIVTVKSRFNDGVFRQSLNCVRLPNQTKDFQFIQSLSNDNRADTRPTAAKTNAQIQDQEIESRL